MIQENIALAPYTSLKVGGNARFIVEVANLDELKSALKFAREKSLQPFFLGGGSNVVISDFGWEGLVIRINMDFISVISEDLKTVFVEVGAGVDWDKFVQWSVERSFSGITCLSGIPGKTGSTPIQNVGAYGQEVSETIEKVQVWSPKTESAKWISNAECNFSYRNSAFKTNTEQNWVVISVVFKLRKNDFPELRYGELKREVESENISTLSGLREKVLEIRRRKSMVLDENDRNSRSAGSFFTNPILSETDFHNFVEKAIQKGCEESQIPTFPAGEGNVKLAAGWLIEKSGFEKGCVRGNVGLSEKHALAIINRGNGTAQEIFNFAREIKKGVFDTFGVALENEPQFVGKFV